MRRARQLVLIACTVLPIGTYLACGEDAASPAATNKAAPDGSIVIGHQPDGAPITEPGDDDDGGSTIVTDDGGIVVSANIDFDPDGDGDPTSNDVGRHEPRPLDRRQQAEPDLEVHGRGRLLQIRRPSEPRAASRSRSSFA